MSAGTTKDRQLLEVLDEVITRNKAEYEIDDGYNEDPEGESEHADDDDDLEIKTQMKMKLWINHTV